MRVLDVGCGIGGPARAIARFSQATVSTPPKNLDFYLSFYFTISLFYLFRFAISFVLLLHPR